MNHRILLASVLLASILSPAARADAASERGRIAAERARSDAEFAAETRQCAQRFLVNQCIDSARMRQRQRDAAFDRRLNAVDLAERRELAAQERARVKAALAEHHPAGAAASEPRSQHRLVPVPMPNPRPSRAASPAPRRSAQDEAERAAAYADKQAEYRARQAAAAASASGTKPALPLPP